jgi:ABC-type branched-subunit amino acid transport system ATPase component
MAGSGNHNEGLCNDGKGLVMIGIRQLTKRYGSTVAVDGLSFDVRPGLVTGFLGPNGSGKPVRGL